MRQKNLQDAYLLHQLTYWCSFLVGALLLPRTSSRNLCLSHVLNLSMEACCKLPEIQNMTDGINSLFLFFDHSPKRQRILELVLGSRSAPTRKKTPVWTLQDPLGGETHMLWYFCRNVWGHMHCSRQLPSQTIILILSKWNLMILRVTNRIGSETEVLSHRHKAFLQICRKQNLWWCLLS